MKDNFSTQAEAYAQYRPTYPQVLYDVLLPLVNEKNTAWDCGTGNGQVASELSTYFDQVIATDISAKQLKNAVLKKNIDYKLEPAEQTSIDNHSVDLITVGQAIHWFNFETFYQEVYRTLKPKGVIAVIGYALHRINPELDLVIDHFYHTIIGPYWDKERKYIDEYYQTIPFPFEEIAVPAMNITYRWTFEQYVGYLNTWSAVQHYIKDKHQNPVELISEKLKYYWNKQETEAVIFPILCRIGKMTSHSSHRSV